MSKNLVGHFFSKPKIVKKYSKRSKRKLNSIKIDRGREFNNDVFQNYFINNNNKTFSRNTNVGAVFARRFNRTIGDLP